MSEPAIIDLSLRWQVIEGDALAVLATLPDGVVQTCVTSPPYFGLRDYGTGRWEGGDAACDHIRVDMAKTYGPRANSQREGLRMPDDIAFRDKCGKCCAVRIDAQIGLEPTPAEYVERLVAVFREVRRCLRDDGTLWLNLGDSYNNFRVSKGPGQAVHGRDNLNGKPAQDSGPRGWSGLKEKDLVGIPWRVAFALQSDGWYLRSDIIWAKPNPMPESVTDRPTKAHEYLFLLAKSQRYCYDAAAIAEDAAQPTGDARFVAQHKQARLDANQTGTLGTNEGPSTRNRRSVWSIATEPFPGAHFAVMPTALVKPCILAGCPKDGLVLDPFTGSGTVGDVATELGCRFFGAELNPAYAAMARERIGRRAAQGQLDLGGSA